MNADRGTSFRFWPIQGYRVFEEVVDQLTYAIRSGAYGPGDRLPTLDRLAVEMQTSRPSIGEAIGLLVSAGVLETKRGTTGGTLVKTSSIPLHSWVSLGHLTGRRCRTWSKHAAPSISRSRS